MSDRRARFEQWVFTINNYTEENVDLLVKLDSSKWCVVCGREVGAQGTKHLQGVLWREDDVRVDRKQVEKVLGGRAWCDPCRCLVSAVGYSIKDGDFFTNLPPDETFADAYDAACEVCKDNEWLGWMFFNHYGYPSCPHTVADMRVYYQTYLFNTN